MPNALENFKFRVKRTCEQERSILQPLRMAGTSPFAINQVVYSLMPGSFTGYQKEVAEDILNGNIVLNQYDKSDVKEVLAELEKDMRTIEQETSRGFGLKGIVSDKQISFIAFKATKTAKRKCLQSVMEKASQLLTIEAYSITRHI